MKKLKITNNSPAILGFALVSLGVLILNILTGGKSNQLLFMTWHSSLKSPLTYLRFFTHILGHSSWSHYIGNMAYILLLGPMLEEKYGSQKILEVMGITALVTALVNYIFFPAVALCGASGVVFAFILLTSFTSFRAGELPVTVILVALIYLVVVCFVLECQREDTVIYKVLLMDAGERLADDSLYAEVERCKRGVLTG